MTDSIRIQVIALCTDSNRETMRETLIDKPVTARGVAAAYRRWEEHKDWIRRNFGPGTIYPAHHVWMRVVVNGRPVDPRYPGDTIAEYIAAERFRTEMDRRPFRWGDIAHKLQQRCAL